MFAKILGIIWLLPGVWWFIYPQRFKSRMQKKMTRRMRRSVFGASIALGVLMAGSAFSVPGFLPKIIGLLGMVIAIKAIILVTSKTSERVFEWWVGRPLIFFRMCALFLVLTGLALMIV
jgi:hypothetical protein